MDRLSNQPSRALQDYAIAKQWSSDLDFHKTEAVFIHQLLDDYSIRLSAPHYLEQLKSIKCDLHIIETEIIQTSVLLTAQLLQLELASGGVVSDNIEDIEGQQIKLECLMSDLNRAFRKTKRALFKLIEELVENDEIYG